MTAEQAAENIKAKIDELASKAERVDALADVASDYDWRAPASVTTPSRTSSARFSSTSSSDSRNEPHGRVAAAHGKRVSKIPIKKPA
jgi:hypothetical protein